MADCEFEWDTRKAESNERKHGIGFPLAARVFDDPFVEKEVEGDEHGETRWTAFGQVGRAIVRVTYTTRDKKGVEVVRLISARKATRSERRKYEGHSEDDR